jgi:hypothetical protein
VQRWGMVMLNILDPHFSKEYSTEMWATFRNWELINLLVEKISHQLLRCTDCWGVRTCSQSLQSFWYNSVPGYDAIMGMPTQMKVSNVQENWTVWPYISHASSGVLYSTPDSHLLYFCIQSYTEIYCFTFKYPHHLHNCHDTEQEWFGPK